MNGCANLQRGNKLWKQRGYHQSVFLGWMSVCSRRATHHRQCSSSRSYWSEAWQGIHVVSARSRGEERGDSDKIRKKRGTHFASTGTHIHTHSTRWWAIHSWHWTVIHLGDLVVIWCDLRRSRGKVIFWIVSLFGQLESQSFSLY